MEKSVAESGADLNVSMDKPSHEPSSCKMRRRCDCDWMSGLPDEIMVSILDKLDSKTAVSTSILSRRWRHLWRFLQSFHFSEPILPDSYCRVRIEQMVRCSNENRNQHFVESMGWFAGLKRETLLRRLYLVFSGSTECADVVNSAIASAVEHGIEEIDMAVIENTMYEFPWWLFTGGSNPSLTSLCLSFCKLSVPLKFGGFSSLTKLALIHMHMSLKETQLVLRCCRNLVTLHLIDVLAIRIMQLPKLKQLILLWSLRLGEYRIDTPALQRLEYCGEMLLASTFQSMSSLEHVSLQYMFDEYRECHAEKLENISTCFPYVRSLLLWYEIPKVVKPRTPAVFLSLKVLTLKITTKPSDDLLWMAMFLNAAPYMETLRTTIRYLSHLDSHNGVVWDDVDFQHDSLKNVEMYNFMGRDNEIGLARLLLYRAPNLRCISFNQAPLEEGDDHQLVPLTWPGAETFVPRDSQFVLSKLFENVSSSACVVFI
ncbi:hypothetical protein ACQ4PT_061286 [Festuca glaucescens]